MARAIRKVLIANRGEIAVRIARTLHEMGIRVVAVFSDADRNARHVRVADEAYRIGPAPAYESYLRVDVIIDTAKLSGCDALHPGYGFLSENPDLADACEAAGIIFLGPPASAMHAMGSKTAARKKMTEAGVPVVPGALCDNVDEARAGAATLGYPVLLKAANGGGGKGMRLVARDGDMQSAWELARSEAKKFFGDDTVYLEKAIIAPRHVEIQVLGDRNGNIVHLFERDCSIQRRNQKVIEETPTPVASRARIAEMGAIAVRGAAAVGYFSAGTFEFLLAPDGSFYFLEMNTRLQVEHTITELVTGLDLVREMIRIGQGEPLGFGQGQVETRGAAMQCRIYAEDPANAFLPSPGTIHHLQTPAGPGVRDDSGVYEGCEVSSYYDPLLSKLCVWAPTRDQVVARMLRALSEYVVAGIHTNLAFHEAVLRHPDFIAGLYDTGFLDRHRAALTEPNPINDEQQTAIAIGAALAAMKIESGNRSPISETSQPRGGTSPWVAAHRARLRSH